MGNMKKLVSVLHEAEDVCILYVSGDVTSIDQVVDWVGGFICPKHDDSLQYSAMHTEPAGGVDGDILMVLTDGSPLGKHLSVVDDVFKGLETGRYE